MSRDDEVFSEALDMSPEEQAAFLEQVGQEDPGLRDRVVALLAGLAAADRFLQESPVTRPPPPPEEQLGDKIGRYTLLRKLGEGGCGVVYLAEQTEPVRRKVALKVIKLGMDTLNVIARFEAERQALAMMDHPDIARVFDAGSTETGRPYFVMEFVDGVPITQFCDQHQLTMGARLELFAQVCSALQHAHQKGIIHRDIKPSNVLVSMRDDTVAPKIIDFGIAKATQGRLTEHTLQTCLNQFIGTPAYMSPEQAELRELDVDTRSDVYSLGVLLYELLAGRPPYDPKSLQQAGIDEIRRIIREIDPPRPSAAVSTLTNADRSTIAAHRRAVPTRLTSVLEGDLDWIVMRCLEKQRDRRYGTASELAEDVRRHLRNEPVQARPPHPLYKLRKFVVRNRLACASATAVLLSIVIGGVVAANQAVRALRAERIAITERDAAESARAAEAIAREDAQRRQDQAEELLTFMIGDFRTGLQSLGRLDLLDAVGAKAMVYFESLPSRDLTDTALTRQAKALTQIGEVRMDQANYEDAQASFAAAHERAAALAARQPDDADIRFELAQAEFWMGYIARARGETAEQRNWLVRYRDSALRLQAIEGNTARAQGELVFGHHNLAVLNLENGDLLSAANGFNAERESLESMATLRPDDSELLLGLADVNSWLGSTAEFDGRFDAARTYFEATLSAYDRLIELEPGNPKWTVRRGDALGFVARLLAVSGKRSEAATRLSEASSLIEPAVAADPENQRWLITLLRTRLLAFSLDQTEGDFTDARNELATTRDRLEQMLQDEPTSQRYFRDLSVTWFLTARSQFVTGATEDRGAQSIARAVELGEQLLASGRAGRAAISELAYSLVLAGRIAASLDSNPSAEDLWRRATTLLDPLVSDSRDWRLLEPAAEAHRLLGELEEARVLQGRLDEINFQSTDPLTSRLSTDLNP